MNPMKNAPQWVRLAVYGALFYVAVGYFIEPTLSKATHKQMSTVGDILNHTAGTAAGAALGPAGQVAGGVLGIGGVNDSLAKDKHMKLSALAKAAGVSDGRTAAAVALAESSGNKNATNHNSNGTQDTGLWQINDIHAGVAGSPKDVNAFRKWLKNPENNAKAMASISNNGTNWTPWVTYNNGAYRRYLGKDKDILVDKNTALGAASDAVSAVTNPLEDVGRFFAALVSPDTWFRIAKTGTGGVLIIAGTATLLVIAINKASATPVGQAAKTVKRAMP